MEFNELVKDFLMLFEDRYTPFDSKRRSRPTAGKFGSQSPNVFDTTPNSPSKYGGFKGDSLNPAMATVVFPLPNKDKKKKVKVKKKQT